jgi:hypothetical protein
VRLSEPSRRSKVSGRGRQFGRTQRRKGHEGRKGNFDSDPISLCVLCALCVFAVPGVPFGIGLAIPINRSVTAGFETSYNFLIGESFSKTESIGGGDPLVANAVLRARY